MINPTHYMIDAVIYSVDPEHREIRKIKLHDIKMESEFITQPSLTLGNDTPLAGRDAVLLTPPIPSQPDTRSMIPQTYVSAQQYSTTVVPEIQTLITTQEAGTTIPYQSQPMSVATAQPVEAPVPSQPEKSDQDISSLLYSILMSEGPAVACACSTCEFYKIPNSFEGKFKAKLPAEIVYRDSDDTSWKSTNSPTIAYTRWGSKGPNVLLIHDALGSRREWIGVQKTLSPFMDTVALDLLGSGDSTLVRGWAKGEAFPWSFNAHSQIATQLAEAIWPGEKFMVVGTGWGAQIAAQMATMSEDVNGFMMINPTGFAKDTFPEMHYLEFWNMRKMVTDEMLNTMPTSFTARVVEALERSFSSSDTFKSGRDSLSAATVKTILQQYRRVDRKRILIDQIVMLGNNPHQAFPIATGDRGGLDVAKIKAPCFILTGGNDIIYSPGYRHYYPHVYFNSRVHIDHIPEIGHLAHIENPNVIGEKILSNVISLFGPNALAVPYIGSEGSHDGSEKLIISGLTQLHK